MAETTSNRSDEIKSWLNLIGEFNEEFNDEICPSVVESSIIETSSSSESGEELELGERTHGIQCNRSENILPQMAPLTFNNVNISNSTNVYLGHIFKASGNLNINVFHSEETLQEDEKSPNKDVCQRIKSRPACLIFPRCRWLAMDPISESNKMCEPVDIVVVGYTATTSSSVQARNIGIIRDLQTLNVEAQGFNDIVFNFLIGCDGVVYEGRGWGVEGDHTSGYNHKSIGIAFVGNFKRDSPTGRVLKACHNLCIRGVAEGHLSKDYKLLTSCQFSPNADLDALYEEFKNWDHFTEQNCGDKSTSVKT